MIRRPRRLRVTKQIRDLVHETSIDKTDLIYPMFIIDGETEDIPSMPNIKRYSLTDLPSALDEVVSAGVGAVLYFGIPKTKDEFGSEAYNEFGIVQRAIRLTKELYPNLIVIADICLCEYTSHGHCGVIEHDCIVNDKTLPLLAKASVACAKAGADIITFQLDACPNPLHMLREVKKAGIKAGLGIGPSYDVERLRYLLPHIDGLILMSVEPGYGGQPFEESIYEKVKRSVEIMDETGIHVPISIDGGVNTVTGKKLVEAGADILIAGSSVFGADSITDAVKSLKAL